MSDGVETTQLLYPIPPKGSKESSTSGKDDVYILKEVDEDIAPINHKGNIKFTYQSFERRNIDKALVRSLSTMTKEVKDKILEEFKKLSIDKHEYDEILKGLEQMDVLEKNEKSKKDYANIINYMMSHQSHRVVLKNCLKKKKELISASLCQRVRGKNQKIYLATLNDYLQYIDTL